MQRKIRLSIFILMIAVGIIYILWILTRGIPLVFVNDLFYFWLLANFLYMICFLNLSSQFFLKRSIFIFVLGFVFLAIGNIDLSEFVLSIFFTILVGCLIGLFIEKVKEG